MWRFTTLSGRWGLLWATRLVRRLPGEPIIGDHAPLTLAEGVASCFGNGSVPVK